MTQAWAQDASSQLIDATGAAQNAAQAAQGAAASAATAAQQAQEAAAAAQQAAQAADLASQAAQSADALAAAAHVATGGAIDPTIYRLAIFVLAIFVGYYVVWSVTPALHTPLMSVTNAISSVVVVGALLATGVSFADAEGALWAKIFGFLALGLASVNIFGGFMVTQRMLAMYKKKR